MIEFTALELVLIAALVVVSTAYFRTASQLRVAVRITMLMLDDPDAINKMRGALAAMRPGNPD